MRINLPTWLTLLRILMLPVIVVVFYLPWHWASLAAAVVFVAAAATDWWLGSDVDSPRRMPREQFIEHLTTITMGVISGTAEMLGIKLDPDRPIHDAMPRNSAAS